MKQKRTVVFFILMLAVLPACGTEEAESMSPVEPVTILLEETPGSEGGEERPHLEAYQNSYMQIVRAYGENSIIFSLIYLDEDDIPELAVYDEGYGCCSVYTVKEGEAFCIVDSMRTAEMTYFEHSGMIASFAAWNGGGDEGGYGKSYYQVAADGALTDDSLPVLNYSYNAVYDKEGAYMGWGDTSYYYMGQETDEEAYQEMCGSLGIAEERERLCMENAFNREEMEERLQ